jgi:hypothetical protein
MTLPNNALAMALIRKVGAGGTAATAYRFGDGTIMSQLSAIATSLIDYCKSGDRVCPRGDKWQALWQMLPEDESKTGRGRQPPMPLILAAASCEDWEKRLRLKDHIAWADAQGVIEQADEFLRGLSVDEWER